MNQPDLPNRIESPSSGAPEGDLESACRLLRQCNADSQPSASLQQALKQVAQASDFQILGICVESLAAGEQVLAAYATALGLPQPVPAFADLPGAVYIKFNPGSRAGSQCYASAYSGSERGVLVSCQSAEESDLNEMFGPLPLDLFSTQL
jgi:hypothetical protein